MVTSNNRNVFSHSSGGGKSKIKVSQDHGPCGGCRRESTPCVFQLLVAARPALAILGAPGLVATSLQSLPPTSHHLLLCLSLRVGLLEGPLSWDLGLSQTIQDDLLISICLKTSAKTFFFFSKSGHICRFWGSGRTRTYPRTTIQATTYTVTDVGTPTYMSMLLVNL